MERLVMMMIIMALSFQPLSPAILVENMTSIGAMMAPTANTLWRKLRAEGLLSDTSLTMVLLKLLTLPLLIPVKRKARSRI